MARLSKMQKNVLMGVVAVVVVAGAAYGIYYAVTGDVNPFMEGFDNAAMYQEMGNHDTHNPPMLAGEEDMVLHNEEAKKLQEMEEMNALGCPGMLLTELDPASVNNPMNDYSAKKTPYYKADKLMMKAAKHAMAEDQNMYNVPDTYYPGKVNKSYGPSDKSDKTNPGYLLEPMMNSTGLPGSDVQSSVGAEVTGFIGDNRQFPQFPQDQLDSEELLPKERSDMFAQLFPEGQGHLSNRRDFLTSGFHIGINTVGQTLRNANRQLRSDPPNPQVTVSPWINSTITPDLNRRVLEIGSDC